MINMKPRLCSVLPVRNGNVDNVENLLNHRRLEGTCVGASVFCARRAVQIVDKLSEAAYCEYMNSAMRMLGY